VGPVKARDEGFLRRPGQPCGAYPDWQTSAYVLPYEIGRSFRIQQGNCSPPDSDAWNSHQAPGPWMFAYDFLLPTGTPIVAVRGGEVAWAYDSYPDGPGEYGNSVVIDHGDGTYAGYGHLTSGGGTGGARSAGGSGRTGCAERPVRDRHGPPSLSRLALPRCRRGSVSVPWGLLLGESYEALPY
jgi:murein DD-endopeptidase MepM/ murein hydrolase activator NlpD